MNLQNVLMKLQTDGRFNIVLPLTGEEMEPKDYIKKTNQRAMLKSPAGYRDYPNDGIRGIYIISSENGRISKEPFFKLVRREKR